MKLLTAHGEKLLLLAVVLIASYAFLGVVGSMQTRTVVSAQTYAALDKINGVFSDPNPDISWPRPRHADLLAERFGDTGVLVSGQFRVGAWVAHPPVLLIDRKDFVAGTFGPILNLAARPEIGRVQISWSKPETRTVYQTPEGRDQEADFVEIVKYEVFKRADGSEYPDSPAFVVQQPSLIDTEVDAENTYWYTVVAYGRPASQEETIVVRKPQGDHIQDVRLPPDGSPGWKTVSPEEVSASTPSNITFAFKGAYVNPATGLNTARMTFKMWTNGAWEEFPRAEAVEGGEIVGSRYDSAAKKTIQQSSGHFLVEFGEEMREGVMVPLRFVKVRKGERGRPFPVYDDASRRHIGDGQSKAPAAPSRRELTQNNRPSGGDSLSIEQLREQLRGTVTTQAAPEAERAPATAAQADAVVPGRWQMAIAGFTRPPTWRREDRNLGVEANLEVFLRHNLLAAFVDSQNGSVFAFQENTEPAVGSDEQVLNAFFGSRWNELRDAIPTARVLNDIRTEKSTHNVPYRVASLLHRNDKDLNITMICVRQEDAVLTMVYVHPLGFVEANAILSDILNGFAGTG